MRRAVLILAWFVACSSAEPAADGQCVADSQHALSCGDGYTGSLCTGSARPDDDPQYLQGVPQGVVCAESGERNERGEQGHCCTARTTACAYDPVASCDEGYRGYRCRGANRPDALHAALSCGNGVREGDLINYCCSAKPSEPGCLQSDSVPCSPRLMGFSCKGDSLPRGEQLGANKSRTDFYRLLCSTPETAPNPEYKNYCCYPPAPLPERGSCVAHTEVPGCKPGRFGFACYGPDRPEDDYLPMRCPEPSITGVSAEGYPAKLYCCDFQ
ncbi:MAG TPA: hypothetical protein VJR89_16535 [Polyangiales bacterium]|nr:hypothetical protein [Polyangiales bacterium]